MTAPVELPAAPASMPAALLTREHYAQLARRVRLLSWLSLAWMTVEGVVAIAAGIIASSIALIGFGLDSAIEGLASVIIILALHRIARLLARGRAARTAAGRCPVLPSRAICDLRVREEPARG